MGNQTFRPRLTDEAELAMFNSSLEDIQSRFATLLISVRTALEANHYPTSDVRTILVGMFTGSDDYIPKTNLEEIFDAATRHRLWDYLHHSPVENLLHRCLPDHISLMREYKEQLSGYCTTTKLIDYIKYTNINPQQGHNKLPLGSYTRREQCQKLTVTLGLARNITELSLKYVQDLWERFAEEFNIPFLTAVLDSILSGSLIITWLVPRDVAEKIVTSAHKSTPFFKEHCIISVTIDTFVYSAKGHITLGEQFATLKAKEEEQTRMLEQKIVMQDAIQHRMKSRIMELERQLALQRIRRTPAQAHSLSGAMVAQIPSKIGIEETDTSLSISAQPPELYVWKLPGVEECGETSVVIYSSQGQLVEWNGLKMHIHEGSLPEGIDQCAIYIKASLAGDYEIPENSSLVSAVFWLRCEPQCTFTKPITIEIQHCSTKQDLSRLNIVRAFCSQKQLPYKFKPLGGRFNADTSYGAIEVTSFSGVGVTQEGLVSEDPVSERLYYNQLFYYSNQGHQQGHAIYIIYTWNTEAHINYVNKKYLEQQGIHAGCYQVIELDGAMIQVGLNKAEWTKVMDGQWEIYPMKPMVTKAELDDFKIGRGIPNCVLEARFIGEDCPQLLHGITLSGVKPPYNELTLRLPPRIGGMQQPQALSTVQPQLDVCPPPLTFSEDMSYDQLAVWLTNDPKLVGEGYQQDIGKLKDARVNGCAFLSLNESRLERFGVSFGFQFTLISIIEKLKSSQKPPDSERLPSSASGATPPTTQDQPTTSAAYKKINLDELPTLDELLILKYMDKGEKKKLRIISEANHKWQDIANLISGDANITSVLEQRCHSDPNKCLKQTFISYFISKKPQRYTQDWNGLIELLDDVDLETLAESVKQALPYVCT